ncbi:MAG: hypothetical protein BWY09_02691 [Candidatus Hydrogenedentes bacterium ADurb.Bin179]|nr:MAG: hypothetical protein BWY09_02691 [Candidatus Hydrogenedentes bacterium ADurb.Bin179]
MGAAAQHLDAHAVVDQLRIGGDIIYGEGGAVEIGYETRAYGTVGRVGKQTPVRKGFKRIQGGHVDAFDFGKGLQ